MPRCSSCAHDNPETSRFCGNCARPLSPTSGLATEFVAAQAPRSGSPGGSVARSSATSSGVDEGRFAPGMVLSGRYRIVSLLGAGGMGEVYRATDLKLNQPVALKFLLGDYAANPRFLERFHNEVRIARQVSHPNVCRVYDIGEIEGLPFLSMEYIDGEDLADLLRRIGRLPPDKALEIARKLCAGLAAAHDKGVLHRDLKPGNVMLDGRGQVLITDFGLAGLAGTIEGADVRSGTPQYMAPEQLNGTEVTVRSDIYALGLLLYEVFTGKRAHDAGTMAELRELHQRSSVLSITSQVADVDPVIERVIQRCLDPDPKLRPANALAVAAALPGGDPLAAALAAGETPSPELVAAAGENNAISRRTALLCAAAIVAGFAVVLALGPAQGLSEKIPFDQSTDALAGRARAILESAGFSERPADTAYGWGYDGEFRAYLETVIPQGERSGYLERGDPSLALFWYRQSPWPLDPVRPGSPVVPSDPPVTVSGMVNVSLDSQGRLALLTAVPPQVEERPADGKPPDWSVLFRAAGLDLAQFQPTDPKWIPLVAADVRAAWTGVFPNTRIPARVEAASWRGRATYFTILGPWDRPRRMERPPESFRQRAAAWSTIATLLACMAAACWMAWRNWQQGRGDLRGALRLAGVAFALTVSILLLQGAHRLTESALNHFTAAVAYALFTGLVFYVLYLALEPYVRKRWPDTIIAWTRLLGGRLRDPMVAGHILAGAALAFFWAVLFQLRTILAWRYAGVVPVHNLASHNGLPVMLGIVLQEVVNSLVVGMGTLFIVFLLRAVVRKAWIAGAIFVLAFTALRVAGSSHPWIDGPFVLFQYTLGTYLLLRLGLLQLTTAIFLSTLLGDHVTTFAFGAWYATPTLVALLVTAAIAAYAFRHATSGMKLLPGKLFDA